MVNVLVESYLLLEDMLVYVTCIYVFWVMDSLLLQVVASSHLPKILVKGNIVLVVQKKIFLKPTVKCTIDKKAGW